MVAGIRQDKAHPLSRDGWSGLAFDLAGYIILLLKHIPFYAVSIDQHEGTGERYRHWQLRHDDSLERGAMFIFYSWWQRRKRRIFQIFVVLEPCSFDYPPSGMIC